MTSSRYLGHMTLPDGCDWPKSAGNFLLSIDQTLLLPLTVGCIHHTSQLSTQTNAKVQRNKQNVSAPHPPPLAPLLRTILPGEYEDYRGKFENR